RADAHERVRLERARRGGAFSALSGARHLRERAGERDAEREARAGLEKIAAAQVDDHFKLREACRTARRMRLEVPQRHTLPAPASSISASVGRFPFASSAAALMICPDWQ